MVLAVEVPLCATVSMGGVILLVRTGALVNLTSQDVALISALGCGTMLSVGMVSVECCGASARWSNEVIDLK